MNKSKVTTVDIDWDEVENLLKRPELPTGGITAQMLMGKYSCSRTNAKGKMDKLIAAGWVKHKYHNGLTNVVYVIKE